MHVHIVGNLIGALGNAPVDGPCVVLPSSMKVCVSVDDSDVHRDVSVVCGQPEFVGDGTDIIASPAAIVEVLSDATEVFDRGEKFGGYRAVPSVIDYLLVAHDSVRVEHTCGRDDTWVLREHGPGLRLRLASVAGELAIDEPDQAPVAVSMRSSYVRGGCHQFALPRYGGPAGIAN